MPRPSLAPGLLLHATSVSWVLLAWKQSKEFLDEAEICSPSVVVLDQLDTVCGKRHEVAGITELQVRTLVEGVPSGCLVRMIC